MRAISLFSGAGGFELGFERAGIETILQAEIDPVCLSVLERHWPETERLDDVRSVGVRLAQPERNGRSGGRAGVDGWRPVHGTSGVDLVYGGFPCQDVSAGRQQARLWGAT